MKKQKNALPEILFRTIPGSKKGLERLETLMNSDELPKVAVYGLYNHGKSSLLNALVGEEKFKVADKQETSTVSEFEHDGIIWIDTPGLGADVQGEDDRKANEAVRSKADFVLLVHSIDAGELDRDEAELFKSLTRRDNNYRRKFLLVLTNIDRKSEREIEQTEDLIKQTFPDLKILRTAAKHYNSWVRDGKKTLVKRSGISEVKDYLAELKAEVGELRKKEALRLIRNARLELSDLIKDREMALASARDKHKKLGAEFRADVRVAMAKIEERGKTLEH